ncbi:hydrogenase maturation protease [Salinibaculum rarum]|uniref:hydrogenase maturation protease n=1 Tax=Salinibaculum rarum TaxID=3058903 RepID=UPI00265DC48A|nr:hydrogenase maturation protease [Salinibaculum sp. KK48]
MTANAEEATDAATSTTQAVVGVGSMVMSDDGVGYHAIEALRERSTPAATLTHAGTTAFLALEAMSGADRAIVVDALALDADPGTVREFRLDKPSEESPEVTMHDFSFSDALAVGSSAYDLPEEVLLAGIVPETMTPGVGLSEAVEDALPELVSRIERRLATDT